MKSMEKDMNTVLNFTRFIGATEHDDELTMLEEAQSKLRPSDLEKSTNLKGFVTKAVNKRKVVEFDKLIAEEGYLGIFVIGQLERERLIFRIPCTDLYVKRDNEIWFNDQHRIETLRKNEYYINRRTEKDILFNELKKQNNSDEVFRSFINRYETMSHTPYIVENDFLSILSTGGNLLDSMKKNGILSETEYLKLAKIPRGVQALNSLTGEGRVSRINGSLNYLYVLERINIVPQNSVISGTLNVKGLKKIISIESSFIVEYLKFISNVIKKIDELL